MLWVCVCVCVWWVAMAEQPQPTDRHMTTLEIMPLCHTSTHNCRWLYSGDARTFDQLYRYLTNSAEWQFRIVLKRNFVNYLHLLWYPHWGQHWVGRLTLVTTNKWSVEEGSQRLSCKRRRAGGSKCASEHAHFDCWCNCQQQSVFAIAYTLPNRADRLFESDGTV